MGEVGQAAHLAVSSRGEHRSESMDGTTYLKFVLALALVLGLIGMITWLVRRSGIGARMERTQAVGKTPWYRRDHRPGQPAETGAGGSG